MLCLSMNGLSADERFPFEGLSPYLGILLMALLTIPLAAMFGNVIVVWSTVQSTTTKIDRF